MISTVASIIASVFASTSFSPTRRSPTPFSLSECRMGSKTPPFPVSLKSVRSQMRFPALRIDECESKSLQTHLVYGSGRSLASPTTKHNTSRRSPRSSSTLTAFFSLSGGSRRLRAGATCAPSKREEVSDDRQILGPRLLQPEAYAFGDEQRRVGERRSRCELDVSRRD